MLTKIIECLLEIHISRNIDYYGTINSTYVKKFQEMISYSKNKFEKSENAISTGPNKHGSAVDKRH